MDMSDILRAVLQGAQSQGGTSAGSGTGQEKGPPAVPSGESHYQPPSAHEGGGGGGHGGVSAPPASNPAHGTSHRRPPSTPSQSASGNAGDVLGSILGGSSQPAQTGSNPMGDVLGAILGGATQQSSTPSGTGSNSTDPIGAILGGILGGGAGMGGTGGAGSDPISAILGALMGGTGQPAPNANTGDVLGSILGSGGTNATTNSFLTPIVDALAQKMDIPPAVAATVVNFAISKLLAAHASGGSHGAFAVDHLMEHLNSAGGVDQSFGLETGAAQELSQRTGMDQHTAATALQTAFNEIGARAGK